jgi:hypothetical protein
VTTPPASEEVPATISVSEDMGQLEPQGQRVNIAGIQFASRIMLWDHHLAVPHISVPDIR